jgi:hypothetical protein
MLTQILSLSDRPPLHLTSNGVHTVSIQTLPRSAEALPRARPSKHRQPLPSEPPEVTNLGLPIQNSQGARHPRPGKPDGTTRPDAHKPTWLSPPHWTGNLSKSSKAHREAQGKARAAATIVRLVTWMGHRYQLLHVMLRHPRRCSQPRSFPSHYPCYP